MQRNGAMIKELIWFRFIAMHRMLQYKMRAMIVGLAPIVSITSNSILRYTLCVDILQVFSKSFRNVEHFRRF